MYILKQELAAMVAEAKAGGEILITRHNKPVARLIEAGTHLLHRGALFGKANLKPALRKKTAGRYLDFLEEDRRSSRE